MPSEMLLETARYHYIRAERLRRSKPRTNERKAQRPWMKLIRSTPRNNPIGVDDNTGPWCCRCMGLEKCNICDGIHYRNAPCPPALLARKAASVAASSPTPNATARALGVAPSAKGVRPIAAHGQKGAASKSTNPVAKATKAIPRDDAPLASEVDGVASRLSAGRTAQGAPAKAASAALKKAESKAKHLAPKKDTRVGDRHKPGYWADYGKKYRARLKAEKEGKS